MEYVCKAHLIVVPLQHQTRKFNQKQQAIMEKMKGFYFYTPSREYFFVTKQTRRTKKFCKAVEEYLNEDGCRFVHDGMYHDIYATFSIREKLEPATCEVKETNLGAYYDIQGKKLCRGGFAKDGRRKLVVL